MPYNKGCVYMLNISKLSYKDAKPISSLQCMPSGLHTHTHNSKFMQQLEGMFQGYGETPQCWNFSAPLVTSTPTEIYGTATADEKADTSMQLPDILPIVFMEVLTDEHMCGPQKD